MLRSMYSGISGMKVNQTKLDVIGNNIANVGTTGFKSSKARFQDMLSQNVKDAMAPSMNQGGVNSKQVGLGVQLASIDTVMTQGNLQPTGRSLDLAIDGEGFFMVSKGPAMYEDNRLQVSNSHTMTQQSLSSSGSTVMYSRDGSFILDESGNLLTSDGYRVMGYGVTNDNNGVAPTAQKPEAVSTGGFDFNFGPGSQLNGYKVILGQVGPGTVTSAELNTKDQTLIVNGDFSQGSTLKAMEVEAAVNKGLSAGGVSQRINVSGKVNELGKLGSDRAAGGFDSAAPDDIKLMGATFKFAEGSNLNGINFKIIDTNSSTLETELNGNVMEIKGSFLDGGVSAEDLKTKINAELKAKGKTTEDGIIGVSGAISPLSQFKATADNAGLAAVVSIPPAATDTLAKSPGAVTVGGMSIILPAGTAYNSAEISIVSQKGAATAAVASGTPKKITITGDFTGAIATSDIQNALNTIEPGFKVGGSLKLMPLNSDQIAGGTDAKEPDKQTAFNLTFKFDKGATLNGYTVVMGTMSAGTKPSADVDTNKKTIIVNGDFTTPGAVDIATIENKINKALQDKTINQGIRVSGTPVAYTGVASNAASGGTPVQSISGDGTINFVDGTKTLKSYDGSLKTLKIPDKVKIPGTNEELRVKSYTIDKVGIVNAILENGSVAAVGQIAMASFKNPEGLSKLGGNLYTQSANSGEPNVRCGVGTTLKDDNSKAFGVSVQGMLEMSNVDLAEQFTDMIVTNRAFQASGKMISTGDEILQDIINLKR